MQWRALTGQVIEGKYHLADFIAAGSFGGVFRADEVVGDRLMRTLAVKLIHPPESASEDERRRIQHGQLDELQLSASLDHPGIVRCFSIGECELGGQRLLYVVMELGEFTLEHRIARQPLSAQELRELAFELAGALDYLHSLPGGLVHRDLKPANILRIRDSWKLSDLGTARQLQGNQVLAGDAMGTAEYAPPESYFGTISPAWDVWSLGVILVEAGSGELPFSAASAEELRRRVTDERPQIPDALPAEFADLVIACLHKQREQRPSARQLLRQLGSIALQPPAAAPQSAEPGRPLRPRGGGTGPLGQSAAAGAPPVPRQQPQAPQPPLRPPPAVRVPEPVAMVSKDPQELLSQAILAALQDDLVTSEEKRELNTLRKQLGISLEEAARLFAEIKANPRRPLEAPAAADEFTARPSAPAQFPSPEASRRFETEGGQLKAARLSASSSAAAAGRASARQIIVDASGREPGSTDSIAAAIMRAAEGERIIIRPGLYRESIVINKRLELIGDNSSGGRIVVESLDRHTLIMQTDHAVVRGLELSCRNTRSGGQACALCVPSGELVAENCRLSSDSAAALTIFGMAANPTLRDCEIESGGDVAVSISHRARALLLDCTVKGGKVAAVFIADGAQPILRRCTISDSAQYGLLVYKGGAGELEQCSLSGNALAGVALKASGPVALRHCSITDNQQFGLLSSQNAAGSVTDSEFRGNRLGAMQLEPGSRLLLRGNSGQS